MKRTKIAVLATIIATGMLITSKAKAQDDYKKFQFGLKTEGKLTWFKPDNKNMTNEGIRLGYSYGLMGDYFFGKNYAFSSGITVSTNGGKIKYAYDTLAFEQMIMIKTDTAANAQPISAQQIYSTNTTYTYKVTDIEVPLMLKFRTNEIGYMKYFGMFGLGLHFRWKAKGNYEYDTTPIENDLKNGGYDKVETRYEDIDMSNQISFLRTSLIIGGGAEYNLSGNTSVVFGISFKNGINNTFTKKTKVNGQKVENRTMSADDLTTQGTYIDENGNIYVQDDNNSDLYKKDENQEPFQYSGPFKKAITNQICLTVGIIF